MSGVWLGRGVRFASGVAVLAVVGAVVLAGVERESGAAATPEALDGAAGRQVAVAPSATTLVCVGPLILPEDTSGGDAEFDPVPVDPVTTVSVLAARTDGVGAGPVAATSLDGGTLPGSTSSLPAGGGAFVVSRPTTASVVRAEPTEEPARAAATSSTLVTAGDLRGLTAASCQVPATESWLVGGATDISSTAQLVLSNAGTTPAEVLLQVWGPSGPVDLTGERYLVAPGAQQVVVLGGVAPELRALALRVQATGGRVTASVQDSALDGFTPTGTDLVVPGAAPATRQVVPGVSVEASQVGDAAAPVLRLLAPDGATTARVTLLGVDGTTTLPGVEEIELSAGAVTDVPLGGLPAGSWTVLVEADLPVVAAAQVSRTGLAGELDEVPRVDRAWAASVTADGDALVALPADVAATVVVGAVPDDVDDAAGSGTGTLRLLGADGSVLHEEALRLDAGATLTVPLAGVLQAEGLARADVAGVELVTDSGLPLPWAVVLEVTRADGVLVSVVEPVPAGTATPDVTVREGSRLTVP